MLKLSLTNALLGRRRNSVDVAEQAGLCSMSHGAVRDFATELGSPLVLLLQAA